MFSVSSWLIQRITREQKDVILCDEFLGIQRSPRISSLVTIKETKTRIKVIQSWDKFTKAVKTAKQFQRRDRK